MTRALLVLRAIQLRDQLRGLLEDADDSPTWVPESAVPSEWELAPEVRRPREITLAAFAAHRALDACLAGEDNYVQSAFDLASGIDRGGLPQKDWRRGAQRFVLDLVARWAIELRAIPPEVGTYCGRGRLETRREVAAHAYAVGVWQAAETHLDDRRLRSKAEDAADVSQPLAALIFAVASSPRRGPGRRPKAAPATIEENHVQLAHAALDALGLLPDRTKDKAKYREREEESISRDLRAAIAKAEGRKEPKPKGKN